MTNNGVRRPSPIGRPRADFTLARLLLAFWENMENDAWLAEDTLRLIRCDNARVADGIPSFLD